MQPVHEKLLNTAQTEILSDKSLRYKRNGLAIGLIIIGVHVLGAQLHDLTFFGAKLPGDQRTVALLVLWVAYAYSLIMYAVYGFGDWQNWVDNLTKMHWHDGKILFFPELKMYWEHLPTNEQTFTRYFPIEHLPKMIGWEGFEPNDEQDFLVLYAKEKNEAAPEGWAPVESYRVPLVLAETVRRSVYRFAFAEIAIPAVVLLAAVLATMGYLPVLQLGQ